MSFVYLQWNLTGLVEMIFEYLQLIRIYTKPKGGWKARGRRRGVESTGWKAARGWHVRRRLRCWVLGGGWPGEAGGTCICAGQEKFGGRGTGGLSRAGQEQP